jgi:hypothetical protein
VELNVPGWSEGRRDVVEEGPLIGGRKERALAKGMSVEPRSERTCQSPANLLISSALDLFGPAATRTAAANTHRRGPEAPATTTPR